MMYKNETSKNIKYRLVDSNGRYYWKTIRPTESIDIPYEYAKPHDLKKVDDIKADAEKNPEGIVNKVHTPRQSPEDKETKLYRKRLVKINGVGNKTAEEIIEKYPVEESLIFAINNGDEIHNRDDVDEKVKKEFLNDGTDETIQEWW